MFGFKHGRLGSAGTRTLIQRAIASLRARGTDAHLWLPGVGTINGLTTGNYLESTGNTVATVDNPTGLVLDALGTVGNELVTNGGFDSDTVWSKMTDWSIGSGAASVVGAIGNADLTQAIGVTDGKTYRVTFDIVSISANGRLYLLDPYFEVTPVSTVGTKTFIVVSNAGRPDRIGIRAVSSDGLSMSASIDNISVREVTGIHAQQGTTANKPVLQRGLWNLSSWSYDTSNAAWAATAATLTPNSSFTGAGLLTGLGTTTAYARVVPSNSDYGFNNGTAQTIGFRVKAATGSVVGIWSSATALGANFNLSTASVSGISCAGASMASVGDGSFIICINALKDNIYERSRITLGSGYNASPTTAGVVIGQAFIFLGTLTAAQILAAGGIPVTTSAAASNPDAGKYSWAFDGSNDSLALGSVPFQMSDDHCVIAGLAPASNVSDGYAFNPASGAGTQMVGCLLVTSAGYAKAAWWDDTTLIAITDNVGRANTSFVASAVKVVNAKRLRVNGTQSEATETTPMGTTTVTGGSIGAYSPTGGNKYLGQTGPVLAIKGTVTDAELLMYERLIAALTPNGPVF